MAIGAFARSDVNKRFLGENGYQYHAPINTART